MKRNNKVKFFKSINFKIALTFALMLLVTLEIVGVFFVKHLEQQNINSFKQQVQLPAYVDNSLSEQLNRSNTKKANKEIKSILTNVNNPDITEIRVVDNNGIIRGTSDSANNNLVGQKTTNLNIKNAIYNGRTYKHNENNLKSNDRYYVSIVPLLNNSNGGHNIVGALYVRASLTNVYKNIRSITIIYFFAALIAIILGLFMSYIIARAITKPIYDMRKQTIQISRGNYKGKVRVYDSDELGQLAGMLNNLAVRMSDSQEEVKSEQRRLNLILRHMTDGIIATNIRGQIVNINKTALDFLNQKEEDVKQASILDVLQIRNKYSLRELSSGKIEITQNLSNEDRDLIVHESFSLIERANGEITGLVGVLHDVTEQQKVDEERKQFVSNVSHELRTPLTSVRSYVDTLNEGAWQDKELAPKFLKVIQSETNRMIRMINELLDLSRIDAGTAKLNLEVVNLNGLLNYIINRFDIMIDDESISKQYKINRILSEEALWVEIDTDKFIQVIDNIINNAIKYSPDGGTINCELSKKDNNAIISVSDHGLGIPNKEKKHIFDRFYRIDKARSRAQGGTGLGLAISKEFIEMFHGKIWVDSIEGKGSTFNISLPLEDVDGDDWNE